MRIVRDRAPSAVVSVGTVSYSDTTGFGTLSTGEQRNTALFAPRGISWSPCEADRILMLSADGTTASCGVLVQDDDLRPGELRLRSSGGAEILLRQDGCIVLNGLVITPQGTIQNGEET